MRKFGKAVETELSEGIAAISNDTTGNPFRSRNIVSGSVCRVTTLPPFHVKALKSYILNSLKLHSLPKTVLQHAFQQVVALVV